MRAVRHSEFGDPSVLATDEVDIPEPKGSDLLIEVKAAGINPLDEVFRKGIAEPTALPAIPGSDVSGIVRKVGPDVTAFAEGDRVFTTGEAANPDAGYAEYSVIQEGRSAILPRQVSFEAGAAVGIPGVTAWRSLIHHGSVEPGETVLVHGGTGGVGHIAVQLAQATGAQVIATGGTTAGLARLEDMGVDAAVDYREKSLKERINEIQAPDVILDPHLDKYLELDIDVAAPGGDIITIFGEIPTASNAGTARSKELTLQSVAALSNTPNIPSVLDSLATLLTREQIKPHIDRTFSLEEAAEAHESLTKDDVFGKLLIVP